MIYLDYSANTPADPAVLSAFCEAERCYPANPNSAHAMGRAAHAELGRLTGSIAALLSAETEEIIYTSGATESNNLAIKGIARASRHAGKHILSTALEHASVGATLTHLQQQGYEIDLLTLRPDGTLDPAQAAALLREDTVLVSVSAVDSELGTVQPIRALAALLKDYPNCRLHVDATQAVGKTPLIWDGVDTMSLAPHKFYGLNGSGILLKRKGLVIEPQMHGGASTTIYRSGTPTLALAAAAESALRMAMEHYDERFARVRALNTRLRAALSAYPLVQLNSPPEAVPHILNLSVKGVKGSAFQSRLSERGVCVSVKSACSVDAAPSKAVFAVSRDRRRAMQSWRISLSHLTTDAELAAFLEIFDQTYRELTT